MTEKLSRLFKTNAIKGFLKEEEGDALFNLALTSFQLGPCLEIGSYCGKSSIYLGEACKQSNNTLFAVDHHRGSEEHQPGEEYHDGDLYDSSRQRVDSFPIFQKNITLAELDDWVVPVVSSSQALVKNWNMPLGLIFIDGGHSHEQARHDCVEWSRKVAPGGYLAIHDIFEKPEDGGQGPWLGMKAVLDGGGWKLLKKVESLVVLQRNASSEA